MKNNTLFQRMSFSLSTKKNLFLSLFIFYSFLGFSLSLTSAKESSNPSSNEEACIPAWIINELDADTAGTDVLEFVELYDGGVGNSALDGMVLVFYNGSNNLSYAAYDLDGQTSNAEGYFVIGNAAVPNVSIVIPSNGLQNGADAVALYTGNDTDFPSGSTVTTTNLIDALVYDTNDADDPELLVLLNTGEAQVNEDGGGNKDAHSSQRIPNGSGGARNTSTYSQLIPTPGAENGSPVVTPDFIINELDANTPGTDVMEFVELYDGGIGNSVLDGMVLVFFNGSNNLSYAAYDLDGQTTNAEGYFVIGNAAVPNVSIVIPSNGLQNGADAVALYNGDDIDFPNGSSVTTANLIDALVYDTNDADDPELLVLLNSGEPQINEDGAGNTNEHSLQRYTNGSGGARNTTTYLQAMPTPGASNTNATEPVNLIINEVDADTAGADILEFVELYDGGVGNTPLDGFVLVLFNGSNDLSYNAFDLDGQTTNSQGYFVIGNAAVPNVSVVFPSNGLQNGADAVALYTGNDVDFPVGTAITTANLVDALVYDTNDADDAGLLILLNSGQGQINEGELGDKDGHSNQRIPNGMGGARNTSTYTQVEPTPGTENGVTAVTFLINEVDSDTAGTDTMEFIEIYDGGVGNSSLDGMVVVLFNGSNDLSYNALDLDGYTTNSEGYFVIGNAAVPNVSLIIPSNGIQNGADAVTLYTGDDIDFPSGTPITTVNLLDAFVYDTNDADDAGLLPLLNPGEPQVNEAGGGDKDAHSSQRIPNGSGGARNTSSYSQIPPTPGAENGVVIPAPIVKIHEVQGSAMTIAMGGQTVRVEAIVTGDFQNGDQLRGFFIQEEDADADTDNATSEGIFVYCNSCTTSVSVGDLVDITGLAVDFFGMSQLDVTAPGSDITVISSGNALPSSTPITLPASASTEAEGTFESTEGMLINVTTSLVVSEYFENARYGQLVLTENDRPKVFTDAFEPDAAAYNTYMDQLDRSRIILDDDNNIQNDAVSNGPDEPYFWPRPGASNSNYIRGGDQIDNLQGIMHWSFAGQSGTDAWRIRPVSEAFTYDFTSVNPRDTNPPAVGGSLKVASFNVLNYFTTLNDRGAHSAVELERQREKIAAAICSMDADIVGLIEIENNGMNALNDLLNGTNGINSICTDSYAAINTGTIGTDAITVAFIYNTATVSPQGAHAILDSSVNPLFNDDKNRPALAQTFTQLNSNGKLTVAVNHFKSKGSSCNDVGDPDLGDGSGNCNGTRTDAAIALVDWLATDPTASGDPDFMIIGDLNSYRNESPIDAIKLGSDDISGTFDDFVDLMDFYHGAAAYSYVFDGQTGYLDYALASQSLMTQLTGADAWHINSDEVNIFDYNDGVQDPGEPFFARKSNALPIYEANAFRASDHDPILIGVNLGVPPTLQCPTSMVINTGVGICGATVTFPDAVAIDPDGDLVSVIQTSGPVSGSLFPLGDSIIEYTATDVAGHVSVCTFTITVVDNELPVAVCQDITIQLDASGNATITESQLDGGSTDNCGIASISISQSSFDCSHVGINTVVVTVTDDSGNSTTCNAMVTVEDVTMPVAICQDLIVQLDVNGSVTVDPFVIGGGSTDECGISTYSLDVDTFDCSNIGENIVILTVTDPSGNSASCAATITVVDNIDPVLSCMDIDLELDENGQATIVPEDVIASNTDACGIATTAVDIFQFDCSDIGTPVTVQVFTSDTNGNISTCFAEVNVIDTLEPELICPSDQTVDPGPGNLFYEVPDYFATGDASAIDNCTDPVTDITQSPAPGTLLSDGVYTITISATDNSGNMASCSFELTVESILGVSSNELDENISLLPNPADHNLILENLSTHALISTEVYDMNGRRIHTYNHNNMGQQHVFDVSSYASGIYIFKIQSDTAMVFKRIVIE